MASEKLDTKKWADRERRAVEIANSVRPHAFLAPPPSAFQNGCWEQHCGRYRNDPIHSERGRMVQATVTGRRWPLRIERPPRGLKDWWCSDGQTFSTEQEAEAHQDGVDRQSRVCQRGVDNSPGCGHRCDFSPAEPIEDEFPPTDAPHRGCPMCGEEREGGVCFNCGSGTAFEEVFASPPPAPESQPPARVREIPMGNEQRICVKCARELKPTEPMLGEGFCSDCAPPLAARASSPLTPEQANERAAQHACVLTKQFVNLAEGAIRNTEQMRKVGRPESENELLCKVLEEFDILVESEFNTYGLLEVGDRIASELMAVTPSPSELQSDIDKFWFAVDNSWDIEPREYFEKEARKNGFDSPLAMAVHYMWKREVKVPPSTSVQSTARGVELNMNDKATVRLTAKGLAVWTAHWKHNPYASAGVPADNLITTELWNLFNIFGSHLYNGCEIPFADNKIVIKAELSTPIEE